MKTAKKAKQAEIDAEIKELKKLSREASKAKENARKERLESSISKRERQRKHYAAAVEPVQFANGFVLNGRLLKLFMKKLPTQMLLEAEFTSEGAIEIRHKNGKLTLLDLQDFYKDFKMPKGEELLVELGISLS